MLCVGKLCVDKLCVSKLWVSCVWSSCGHVAGGGGGGRRTGSTQPKTRTPHRDVGKKHTIFRSGLNIIFSNIGKKVRACTILHVIMLRNQTLRLHFPDWKLSCIMLQVLLLWSKSRNLLEGLVWLISCGLFVSYFWSLQPFCASILLEWAMEISILVVSQVLQKMSHKHPSACLQVHLHCRDPTQRAQKSLQPWFQTGIAGFQISKAFFPSNSLISLIYRYLMRVSRIIFIYIYMIIYI